MHQFLILAFQNIFCITVLHQIFHARDWKVRHEQARWTRWNSTRPIFYSMQDHDIYTEDESMFAPMDDATVYRTRPIWTSDASTKSTVFFFVYNACDSPINITYTVRPAPRAEDIHCGMHRGEGKCSVWPLRLPHCEQFWIWMGANSLTFIGPQRIVMACGSL